jgi:uncharacterized phage-associated protein
MLNERKVAQMAAYLLDKQSGTMPLLKLMKLLYLADREALQRFDAPMSGDRLVSMPHGPVLSGTLNHMNGDVQSAPGGWESWISDRENHEVSLRKRPESRDSLDELSDAELEVLESVWGKFGHMGKWEIRDYTHDHCPEWRDPKGSMTPIAYEDVFLALGRTLEDARAMSARVEESDRVQRLFAGL